MISKMLSNSASHKGSSMNFAVAEDTTKTTDMTPASTAMAPKMWPRLPSHSHPSPTTGLGSNLPAKTRAGRRSIKSWLTRNWQQIVDSESTSLISSGVAFSSTAMRFWDSSARPAKVTPANPAKPVQPSSLTSDLLKEEAVVFIRIKKTLKDWKIYDQKAYRILIFHRLIIMDRDMESLALPCPCPPAGHLSLPTHKGRSAPGASPPNISFPTRRDGPTVLTIISLT